MQLDWPLATDPIDLAAGDVHVWAVPLDGTASAAGDPESVLSDDERERAARFAVDPPRRRFAKSRAALRSILGRYLVTAPQDIALEYDGGGKPGLAGGLQASNLQFNLAHSGELALLAVTTGCAVGVDVEFQRAVRERDEIARRYFAAAELDAVLAHDESQRAAAFFRCWTRKEAVLKAIGTGLGYPLDAFEVPIDESAGGWIELPAHGSLAAASCWLAPLDPCADYAAALAMLGKQRKPACFTYRW